MLRGQIIESPDTIEQRIRGLAAAKASLIIAQADLARTHEFGPNAFMKRAQINAEFVKVGAELRIQFVKLRVASRVKK